MVHIIKFDLIDTERNNTLIMSLKDSYHLAESTLVSYTFLTHKKYPFSNKKINVQPRPVIAVSCQLEDLGV